MYANSSLPPLLIMKIRYIYLKLNVFYLFILTTLETKAWIHVEVSIG